jgi:hypothetical protein
MTLRLLYLAAEVKPGNEVGVRDAFVRMVTDGTLEACEVIPHYSMAAHLGGWDPFWRYVLRHATEYRPDLIFIQSLMRGQFPDWAGECLRSLPSNPMVCCHTVDCFGRIMGYKAPKAFLNVARFSDATFLCGMGRVARHFRRAGARRVYLLPAGVCQKRFAVPLVPDRYQPDLDVVFVANRRHPLNPMNIFPGSFGRRRLVNRLSQRYGKRFAIFGAGWDGFPSWQGPLPFEKQHEAYWRGKVAIGHASLLDVDYYCSNRTFIGIASGIPYLERAVPRINALFQDGREVHLYTTVEEAMALCDKHLAEAPERRLELGAAAREAIMSRDTDEHQMRCLIRTMLSLMAAERNGQPDPLPICDFFAPGVSLDHEQPYAVYAHGGAR